MSTPSPVPGSPVRPPAPRPRSGFTLLEMVVAVSITVAFVAASSAAFLYLLKQESINATQASLDIDVRRAAERIKKHMRLSALDKMVYYPATNPHVSVSFPLPGDEDGDGAIDVDAEGRIRWRSTVIYHPWPVNRPRELRVTTFSPRVIASDPERLDQLTRVTLDGNGEAALNHTNAVTQTIFRNLFDWSIRPLGSQYEGYAPTKRRDRNITLGSVILEPGDHEVTFAVTGKDPEATDYHVRIDQMVLTPSYLPLEAEDMTVSAYDGPQPTRAYEANGYWSGNHQLLFEATEPGQFVTLQFENDAWVKSHFMDVGDILNDLHLEFDKSYTPYQYVLRLAGNRTLWSAIDQTLDPVGFSAATGALGSRAARVILYGLDAEGSGFLSWRARGGRLRFHRGADGWLCVRKANIAEAADQNHPTFSIDPTTVEPITFDGGNAASSLITSAAYIESDNIPLEFQPEKTYVVSYRLTDPVGRGATPHIWRPTETNRLSTQVLPAGKSTDAVLIEADWPDEGIRTADLYGVGALFGNYAPEGVYESMIADTGVADAEVSEFSWDATVPTDTSLELKIRAGNAPDLSDAPAWSNITATAISPKLTGLPTGRYLQVWARFQPDSLGQLSPDLRSFTWRWPGETRIVDIGGTFTQAPDQGRLEVRIDGQELKTGVIVDLELFRDIRGMNLTGHQRLRSAISTEITPRNSRIEE